MNMHSKNKRIDFKEQAPARRFWQFLPFENANEILDFGLKPTKLHDAKKLAEWLGIKKCYLKLETSHPTGTVKDRITELLYSYFAKNNVSAYSHCSTGNTGTSLAWGKSKYPSEFNLTLLIPEKQRDHYNFTKDSGIKTCLLENADYDQGKIYAKWYAKQNKQDSGILGLASEFRKEANKIPYLEAYEQMLDSGYTPDYVVQACSSATGLIGGWRAAKDFLENEYFSRIPGMIVIQPVVANPIVRGYQANSEVYKPEFTIDYPDASVAWAIRRGNASSCYTNVYNMIKETAGWVGDATEEQIKEAKIMVQELEGIEIGYTAAVSIAGIKWRNTSAPLLTDKNILFMITGLDRSTAIQPEIDEIITKEEQEKIK